MLERVYKLRIKRAGTTLALLSVSGMLIVSGLFMSRGHALSVDAARDCDSNAVIYCGALTTSELQDKYNNNLSVRRLYKHLGITRADIESIGSTAVEGIVYKSGNVKVNSRTIATGAMTVGRQDMPGSTPIQIHKTTFYERSPSVSFADNHNRLRAFVVMDANGQFRYAIIASCGNPVIATPVMPKPQSAPQAQQVPPTTSSTPTYIVSSSSSTAVSSPTITVQVNQQNAQTGTGTPAKAKPAVQQKASQATPQATQTSQQSVSSAPTQAEQSTQQLVNTGPGPAFTFAGVATMGGTLGRLFFIRRKVLS